jgi:hypothetical protein
MLAGVLCALCACTFTAVPPQKGALTPQCRTRCQSMHDACVMEAKAAENIKNCDDDERWCVSHCGP